MRERQIEARASTGSARKDYTRCRKPEATTLVVGRSFGADGTHGIGAGNRVKEQERPRHRSTRATAVPSSHESGCSLYGPSRSEILPMRKPPTGEPYAGKPHVRFGGRGGRQPFPTPIGRPDVPGTKCL